MNEEPLLDALLRETIPELKLALGEHIDQENQRAIPDQYVKLLPETTLVVALRADAADAIAPIAPTLQRELSDSCMRHGSLYDRAYHVQLGRAEAAGAPLFAISAQAGRGPVEVAPVAPPPPPPSLPSSPPAPHRPPRTDPDATRVDVPMPASGWQSGRWALVMKNDEGEETGVFPLTAPTCTVGRRSEDPDLRADIGLPQVPHVSRRQLAISWDPRGGEPGFRVFNLGLNPVHLGDRAIPGANQKRGPVRVDEISTAHAERWAPEQPLRIGEAGPTLFLRDTRTVEPEAADPDATRFG